ncbi:helix-turn-helix DNA-binding domain protein [Rhodococcus phage NiceHouse]|nr:helix-turn-helix DNA-binding domain protein [Rhodococcus phage NiceHouse]
MATIPSFFFLNDKLHKFIKVVRSDNSVVAWCYQDEARLWLPRSLVRQTYKKAYTVPQAARLINCKKNTVYSLIDKGLVKRPEKSYDISNNSYRPLISYINEDDMLELRQAAWDVLPKNRFGEPYNDVMANEDELIHRMKLGDDREFKRTGDNISPVYKA